MIQLQDVIQAYMVARVNKRKSPDQVEFELHWQQYCLEIYEDICNRTFQPTAYTFITKKHRPREVFAADLKTRVLHHYLDIRLRPLLEKRMGVHTYNNRVGMGQSACQNAVISDIYEVSKGFTQDCWIIKLDVKCCFPNIKQDIAFQQLEDVLKEDYEGEDKDELLYILRICIFSYPTLHCYSKSPKSAWAKYIAPEKSIFNKPLGIGASIGHLPWQNSVNYYFNIIEKWAEANGIRHERYVDDMYFIVSSLAFLLTIPELRKMLAALGARFNEKKFYCQYYTHGCECLGIHIKLDRIYPNKRIINNGIMRAKEFNKCVSPSRVNELVSSLNSYMGICKNTNGFWQAWRIVLTLSPKWAKYVTFDWHNLKLVANPGYKSRELIVKQYNLHTYDKRRNQCRAEDSKGGSAETDSNHQLK